MARLRSVPGSRQTTSDGFAGEQPADGVQRGRETRGPGDPGGQPEQGAEHEPGDGEQCEHARALPGACGTADE